MRVGFFRRRTGRIDLRNHRKIAVIDGAIGYIGSQNLIDSTFKPGLDLRGAQRPLCGPDRARAAGGLRRGLVPRDRRVSRRPALFSRPAASPATSPAQALPSGPGYPRENNQRLIVSLIHAANRRIVITMPYFIPDDALLQALQTAVLRGVDVTLVVPLQMDQMLVCLAPAVVLRRAAELRRAHLPLRQALPARQARDHRRRRSRGSARPTSTSARSRSTPRSWSCSTTRRVRAAGASSRRATCATAKSWSSRRGQRGRCGARSPRIWRGCSARCL